MAAGTRIAHIATEEEAVATPNGLRTKEFIKPRKVARRPKRPPSANTPSETDGPQRLALFFDDGVA